LLQNQRDMFSSHVIPACRESFRRDNRYP